MTFCDVRAAQCADFDTGRGVGGKVLGGKVPYVVTAAYKIKRSVIVLLPGERNLR